MTAPENRETAASRRAHTPGRDPRDIVTEYAFHVDPDLLGVPLAGAFRRAASMLVDLGILALLFPFKAILDAALGGVTDVIVAGLAAWVLWRLGEERQEASLAADLITWGGRLAAGLVLLVALTSFAAGLFETDPAGDADRLRRGAEAVATALGRGSAPAAGGAEDSAAALLARGGADSLLEDPGDVEGLSAGVDALESLRGGAEREGAGLPAPDLQLGELLSGGEGLRRVVAVGRDLRELGEAGSREEAQPVADRLALRLQRLGIDAAALERVLREEIEESRDSVRPWMPEVLRRAAARADSLSTVREVRGDSLLALWFEARRAGDSARARELRREVLPVVAGDSLRELREVREENVELEEEVDRLTSGEGYLQRLLDRLLDDLGLGFGSSALFFTVLVRVFEGRTPGKKLLGTRVVRLNGERLSWWDAFSRFGGYLIGPFTGFLGWLQVLWDPNRQAIHDKIAGTVVIRTRGPGKRYRD